MRCRIDKSLDLEHLFAMDALSIATFHTGFALEKLLAMRALESKRLQTYHWLRFRARSWRLDCKDQFAVWTQSSSSFQGGIAEQYEFTARAWDLKLDFNVFFRSVWNAQGGLTLWTFAFFAFTAVRYSHLFGAT